MTASLRSRARPGVFRALLVVLTAVFGVLAWRVEPAEPDAIVASVTVGEGPSSIAANPTTNKLYVANLASSTVSVLDGSSSGIIATLPVGAQPSAVAVNPDTNKVYVTNSGGASVTVIDGSSDTVLTTVGLGVEPFDVAVNRVTNRVYVADVSGAVVHVLDGATDAVLSAVPTGPNPRALGINTTTNRIYVANISGASVTVIDGSTVMATVTTGTTPTDLAVNAAADRVYVANAGAGSVTIIDGATNTATDVTVGSNPVAVAVNTITDRAYVTNNASSSLSVVDGATASAAGEIALGVTPSAVAVGAATNRVYVAHGATRLISVVDGGSNSVVATFEPATGNASAVIVREESNRAYVTSARRVTVIDAALPTPTTAPPRPSTSRASTTSTSSSTTSTTRRTTSTSTSSTSSTIRQHAESTRAAGADRYATATQLTADLAPGVELAFVTTGESYPDALAVGPIAGIEQYALLVTKRNELPAATQFELGRLKPQTIVVVGGTGAVSSAVEQQLQQFTEGFVLRVAGASRYETAAALSRLEFVNAETVHIVSGEGFADAVSAGQAAGEARGPVLLVTRDDVPDVVAEELIRLRPTKIVIGGGAAAVSAAVEDELRELLGNIDITRAAGADRFATAVALAQLATDADTSTVFVATGLAFADALAATPASIRRDAPMVLVPSSGTVPASVVEFVRSVNPSSLVVVGGTGAIPDAIVEQLL
jgi:YVTN family beta-propeller protein